jgi:hypothetical protein
MRWAFVLAMVACKPAELAIDDPKSTVGSPDEPGTGFATGPWEDPTTPAATSTDDALYEGAWVRIVAPTSGEVVPLGASYDYDAELLAADGSALDAVEVQWLATDAPDFDGDALAFPSDQLPVGTHDVTVVATLPNGDRVSNTVGGVRVQSPIAGTYSGLFSVDGSVSALTITCTGSAVIVLDAPGQTGAGEGDCLVSILGADVPMTWDFSLDASGSELTGSAGVNLVGFFTYEVPMTSGTVDPTGDGLSLEYSATIPFIGDLTAFLEAPRISLDTE